MLAERIDSIDQQGMWHLKNSNWYDYYQISVKDRSGKKKPSWDFLKFFKYFWLKADRIYAYVLYFSHIYFLSYMCFHIHYS